MGHLYKNQNSKFSLWAKRLVWNGLDANAAIEGAVSEAQQLDEVKTADQIMNDAEGKLGKKPDDTAEQEQKEAYDKALLAVRAAKERYQQVAKDLATKVALTARLAAVDPAADLLHADEEMKDIKAKNDLLPQEMRIEVSGIEALINNEADSYYNEKQAVEWFNGEIVTVEEGDETNDKCRAIMADVAEMQQAKLNGFPGLADEKKAVMNTAYILRINEGLAWLNANKATMTADEQKGLRDFDRAKSNWDAAELSKEAQHKAGAEQYFGMILAEQEARRVWQKLPDTRDSATSWRSTTNILSPLTNEEIAAGWNNLPDSVNLYQEAVALFNRARQMAVVSQENRANAGKVYMDATVAYKQAADKFRGVLASYNEATKNNEEDFENNSKDAKHIIAVIESQGPLELAEYKQIKERIKDLGVITSAQLEQDLTRLRELKTAWVSLKATIQERLKASATHIEGDLGMGNYSVDITKVVNDYLAPANMGLNSLQRDMFLQSPSLHNFDLTFNYTSPDGGGIQERTAKANYLNGSWKANYSYESNSDSGSEGAGGTGGAGGAGGAEGAPEVS